MTRKPASQHVRRSDRADQDAGSPRTEKAGLAARQVAARLLAAVVDRRTSLDGLLDEVNGNAAYRALSQPDRALVRAILNSALRHLPQVEATIASLLRSPLPEGARALAHVLNVAAAQILYLDVPDRAAVDLAVEQAGLDPRNKRFANLVNAVLRRLSREKQDLLDAVANKTPALPPWFHERLKEVYGPDHAEAIMSAQLIPAPIDLTVKDNPLKWADRLGGMVLPTGSVRLANYHGAISDLAGYGDGEWWVQDAAAAIPARLFGEIKGKRIVDLCAAPGGKTAQLAAAGAEVTALDMSANRLRRLKENLDRLHLGARTVEANAVDFKPEALFDGALLDAPCSSTGTVRRHPDVPWTKTMDDVRKLARVQEKLLRHALTLVKPGGLVVFSNCSLDPLEGEDMVARILADNIGASRVAIRQSSMPDLADFVTAKGELRTTPAMLAPQGGLDGFYACVLQRN